MNLDWQLILTHIVGFLITVWILKKFAWKPLLGILEERRQKIAADFAGSQAVKNEAEKTITDYQERLGRIREDAQKELNRAINEGRVAAEEIKHQGQREAKEIIERAKEQLQVEVHKARVTLRQDMVAMTMAATEKIIIKQLDGDEQRRLIEAVLDDVNKT